MNPIRRIALALLLAFMPIAAGAQTFNGTAQAGASLPTLYNNVNATLVTVSIGAPVVYGFSVTNTSGATAYVQVFNASAAGIVLGTTVPIMQIPVTNGSIQMVTLPLIGGLFSSGLVIASTTAATGSTGSSNGVAVTVFAK